jgi:poly-gamma-glutamate synthesis protein (capsule biosynthesis protein)
VTGPSVLTVALAGDVMTGRGIDQILPRPGDPALHEDHAGSALDYVALAEARSGAIPRAVGPAYVWGDALAALDRRRPAVRIVNLETAVTARGEPWPKGINYRMNPANVGCLSAARLDCCVLANNHVLDWGARGLEDTLNTLAAAGIATAGAGRTRAEAAAPAVLDGGERGRTLVFSYGTSSSGIPPSWRAAADRPGVNWLGGLSTRWIHRVAADVARVRRVGDIVVVSVHWGPNWGHEIPESHTAFAHGLIEDAGVDVVHGHSSHHAKAIEVHRDRLVLYGCGDLLNDYEGIGGYESFRGDLAVVVVAGFGTAGRGLASLELLPFRIRKFRLDTASAADACWLGGTLGRVSARFGVRFEPSAEGSLDARW